MITLDWFTSDQFEVNMTDVCDVQYKYMLHFVFAVFKGIVSLDSCGLFWYLGTELSVNMNPFLSQWKQKDSVKKSPNCTQ